MRTPGSLTKFFNGNWAKKFMKSYFGSQATIFIGNELVINPVREAFNW